ncbi:MAG TPA: HpcH/HpaI aldolase/citrate lyase family protein [bacterium]|nr:HpcH/HpaI aldolase/citrate lyase family protein [bacterium]HOL35735.1 HpcH/HpaI aldolase/citrate lyase family protein [bacterium]HPP09066.1 HpcH/HpaI aldolase/citrate lyase family protein [bacterium]
MMPENILKKKLKEGKSAIGAFVITAHPTIAEVMARAGFDWLVFDMEHGVIGIESVEAMAQAVSGTSTVPLVRVPWNDFVVIKQVLDTGIMGLIIPMVNTPQQAQQAISATRYPPEGIRGIGPHRAGGFGSWLAEYFERANDNILVVIQIEHVDAVRNLESILSVKGIDCVFIGANDLAASMGFLKNPSHQEVQKNIKYILDVCKKRGIPCGLVATGSQINERIEEGFQFIAVGHDMSLLATACRKTLSEIKWKKE